MEGAQSLTKTKEKSYFTRIKDFLKFWGEKKANKAEQSPPPVAAPDSSGERVSTAKRSDYSLAGLETPQRVGQLAQEFKIVNLFKHVFLILVACSSRKVARKGIKWKPPKRGGVKLNVSGNCTSNGVIGSGGLIRDESGNWLGGFTSKDGIGDTLFAELFGLYHGLSLLLRMGYTRAICESDCKDACEIILNKESHATHPYSSLLLKVTSLLAVLPGLQVCHIPREANNSADFLAKYASKRVWGIVFWDSPPPAMQEILAAEQGI